MSNVAVLWYEKKTGQKVDIRNTSQRNEIRTAGGPFTEILQPSSRNALSSSGWSGGGGGGT